MSTVAILVVDDEPDFLDSVRRTLLIAGYQNITTSSDPIAAAELAATRSFDAAFLDITMPGIDGIELLRRIKEQSPGTECIMMTANQEIATVVRAVRLGAYDYLVKPLVPEQVTHALGRALERRNLIETLRLRSERNVSEALRAPEIFRDIVTANRQMLVLLHEAELHATSDVPVLITGETGVGKELLARAVHRASRRARGPFVAVNMLALSPTLFESEFFGHARGAFTGADRDKAGYLAQSSGGTLFLDEIGDLPLDIQGKLLRILQEGEYVPVGKTKPERADVRFVAATNQRLPRLVEQRKFRKDLFYRLQVAQLALPPLRERQDDIQLLAQRFIENAQPRVITLADEAAATLEEHDWPGNVRELKGVIDAAINLAEQGVIRPEHLRIAGRKPGAAPGADAPAGKEAPAEGRSFPTLDEVERRHIVTVYQGLGCNKTQAARALGIGLQTLHRKLGSYGVE